MTIDINELRMQVHDFKRAGSPMLLLQTTQMGELLDRLEAAEKERDALRIKVERMEKQEPVAEWLPLDSGEDTRRD